jgi:hypothetical protein
MLRGHECGDLGPHRFMAASQLLCAECGHSWNPKA